MPNWANLMLTKKGKSLQAKAIAGANLSITKMKLGAGVIQDGVSPEDLTDLVDPKQILGLTSIEAQSGLARIQSIVTNADLETGYYIRECGVFADDPDEGEVMYAIMTDASPDFLPPGTSAVVISEEFSINIVTENIATITAIIDPEGIVTVANARKIAADAVAEHDESEDAHSGDHNLKGLVVGTDAVKATKKGDLLSLVAGKGIKLLGDISNKIITIIGKSKNSWNPNEAVAVGDIRYTEDGNGPSWAYLECATAGTTGLSEPDLSAIVGPQIEGGATIYETIQDNTVVWIIRKKGDAKTFNGFAAGAFAKLAGAVFTTVIKAEAPGENSNDSSVPTTSWVRNFVSTALMETLVKTYIVQDYLMAQTGFIRFGPWLGGLILQWGFDSGKAERNIVILPLPVLNPLSGFACLTDCNGVGDIGIMSMSSTSIVVDVDTHKAASRNLYWLVIAL